MTGDRTDAEVVGGVGVEEPEAAAFADARGMERSLVAGVNALFRAVESRKPAGARILSDPWAGLFAERDPRVQSVRWARLALPPLRRMVDQLQTVHCVRHRSIDELCLRAVAQGYRQVVVLGAGYDMRASRFPEALDGVRWIEADLPATLERKRRRLAQRRDLSRYVESVPIDLMRQPLDVALARTSFEPARPTCFILEGMVHYLTPARLDFLLASLEAARFPRRILLSFIRTEMYQNAPGLFIRLVRTLREVPRLHFSPEGLAAALSRHGFGDFRRWELADQLATFAPEGRERPTGVSQDVAQAQSDLQP